LQDALWMAGGVPLEHRTDSLSAAFAHSGDGDRRIRDRDRVCRSARPAG